MPVSRSTSGHAPARRPRRWAGVLALGLALLAAGLPAGAEHPLILGIHPYLPTAELRQRFAPLAEYLRARLGTRVTVRVGSSYEAHIHQIGRDQVDVAFLGSASYTLLTARHGRKPILGKLEVDGRPYFHGRIVVRSDSGLGALADLRDRRFAFGDRDSTTNFLVPRAMLARAGITLDQFAHYEFLGSHADVALAVLVGDFDAGAVKDETYEAYRRRGLTAIATSEPLPEYLFVARSDLSARRLGELRDAMLGMNADAQGRHALGQIKPGASALVPASDGDYDGLRRLLEATRRDGGS